MTKKKLLQKIAVTVTAAAVLATEVPVYSFASSQQVEDFSGTEYNSLRVAIATGKYIRDSVPQVTGISYDTKNDVLKWNEIDSKGGYKYLLTVKDVSKNEERTYTTYSNYFKLSSYYSAGTSLQISIQAMHESQEVWINDDEYNYYYDDAYQLHLTSWSAKSNYTVKLPTKVAVANKLGTLTIDEIGTNAYTFKTSTRPNDDANVELWYSKDSNFNDYKVKAEKKTYFDLFTTTGYKSTFSIDYSELLPGTTYYAKARTKVTTKKEVSKEVYDAYEGDKTYTWDYVYNSSLGYYDSYVYTYYIYETTYSDFTNTVKFTLPVSDVSASAEVEKTSITLNISADNAALKSGYEIARKEGKKYKVLAKTTENIYEDKGLESDTKYSYRIRAYSYNANTKKYTYGDSFFISRTTWGSDLKLQAVQTSKTAAKLTWKKVTGADGYEIYKYTGTSYDSTIANGEPTQYSKKELVKTIKKASTTSYKATGLTAGEGYTFVVRAYKTVKSGKTKKNYVIDDSASVQLSFESLTNLKSKTNSVGNTTVSWSPVYSADGIMVDKYDNETETWVTYKNLKKTSKSITLKSDTVGKTVQYRIYTYKGKKKGTIHYYYVNKYLATPTNVKAKKTSDGAGVNITWSKVAGADYYVVYRSTEQGVYNSDTKSYSVTNGETVPIFSFKAGDELDNAFAPEYSYYYEVPYSYDSNNYTYTYNWSAATKYYYSRAKYYQERIAEAQQNNSSYLIKYYQDLLAELNKELEENPTEDIYNVKRSYSVTDTKVTDIAVAKTNDAVATLKVKNRYSDTAASTENITSSRKGNVTTFYEGPQAGVTYYYYVKAYSYSNSYDSQYNDVYGGQSIGYSKPAKVTVGTGLKAPKLSSAKSAKKKQVTLKWGSVNNAEKYVIYRATSKKGKYEAVATVSAKKKTYTDKKLKSGKTYYYKIRAYKTTEAGTDLYSSYSAAKKVKVK